MQKHNNLISLAILSMSMLATAQHARAVKAEVDLSEITELIEAVKGGVELKFTFLSQTTGRNIARIGTTATGAGLLLHGAGVGRSDRERKRDDYIAMAIGLVLMALANGDSILEVLFPAGEK